MRQAPGPIFEAEASPSRGMTMTLKKILLPLAALLALAVPAQAMAAPKSKFRFAQATYVATEGQGYVDVTVTRTARKGHSKVDQRSSVSYAVTGGSAASPSDYTLTPSSGSILTFPGCTVAHPA